MAILLLIFLPKMKIVRALPAAPVRAPVAKAQGHNYKLNDKSLDKNYGIIWHQNVCIKLYVCT